MRRPVNELLLAGVTVAGIGMLYAVVSRHGAPRPGGSLGHGLGVIGFLLMLSTEVLYTLRKRWQRFRRGRMSVWLKVHIFTGIVGPFLVVLHSSGKFHGLAGLVTLLTVLIVFSGFVGRYLYSAIPRTVGGTEMTARELELHIAQADQQLQARGVKGLERTALIVAAEMPPRGGRLIALRLWLPLRQRRRLTRAMRKLHDVDPERADALVALFLERYRLLMAINSLALARRLLSLWHLAHVPLAVVLFTLAFVHIGAALYYSTLLR